MIPLKSDYSKIEKTFVSKYNREETWSKLLDVLVQTETPLDIVDKSSGLLVSKQVDMSKLYTYEDDKGSMVDGSKMVVASRYKTAGMPIHPQTITGTWNVRMTDTNNQVTVTTNLINVKANTVTGGSNNPYAVTIPYDVKSTGVFESMIKRSISF